MNVPYSSLVNSCTLSAPSVTLDATGAEVISYPSTYTGVPCRLTTKSADYLLDDGRLEGQDYSVLQIPYADESGTAYAVPRGSRATIDGVVYRVLGDSRDSSAKGVLQRLDLVVWT